MDKPDYKRLCAELLADYEEHLYRSVLADKVRAALAEPQPEHPTDGEVAELVEWLRESASYHDAVGDEEAAAEKCRRIADLLERKQPETPTAEELDELFTEIDQSGEPESWRSYARAVLARWGK